MKQRIDYLDFLRGVCVYFVVLGHCFRTTADMFGYGDNGAELFIVKFIYSYHMPLFMCISGYFASHRTISNVIYNKTKRLLVPLLFWGGIKTFVHLIHIHTFTELVKIFMERFLTNYWFIWAVFLFNILLVVIEKISCKNKYIIVLILSITMLFIPDFFPSFASYKFMLPYYFFGCWIKENDYLNKIKMMLKKTNIMNYIVISGFNICFTVLLMFYKSRFLIDVSDMFILEGNIWDNLYVDIYRWMTGVVGLITISLDISCLWKLNELRKIMEKPFIYCGKNSLEIYIVHYFAINYLLVHAMRVVGLYSFILIFISSFFVLVISCVAIQIIKKMHLGKIAFGE